MIEESLQLSREEETRPGFWLFRKENNVIRENRAKVPLLHP